uniref:C2H2-type domain-containing protein n=1 Tax=Oryzias melastigma TaxID=30732 RepID=A0A3B3BR63_ORYME
MFHSSVSGWRLNVSSESRRRTPVWTKKNQNLHRSKRNRKNHVIIRRENHSPTLENPSLTDTEEILIKCCVCGKTSSGLYGNQSQMKHQDVFVSGVTLGLCERCRTRLDQKDSGTVQVETISDKLHSCDTCGKVFKRFSNLKNHMKEHQCDEGKKHMKIHKAEKKLSCNICEKTFSQYSTFGAHMKSHSVERPFTCDLCGKGFKENSGLKRHMKIHTSEKPHTCDICGNCFREKNKLDHHMRIHTGEKPFTCEPCGKCFSLKRNLNYHMRTHSAEKPFKCETCGKFLQSISSLKNHMKTSPCKNSFDKKQMEFYKAERKHSSPPSPLHKGMLLLLS